jgi:putative flippase GtrA
MIWKIVLIAKSVNRHRSLLRFACVGGVGFCVDVIALFLIGLFLPYPIARGVSFWIAASGNWWLNRNYTFINAKTSYRQTTKEKYRQWLAFLGVSCIGFLPSWLCYVLLLEHTVWAQIMPVIAIVPGVLIGMFSNYLLSKYWVFKKIKPAVV